MSQESEAVTLTPGQKPLRPTFAPQRVAVVGATGMVGKEVLSILSERKFPLERLTLCASERSAGTELQCQGTDYIVKKLTPEVLEDQDLVFFAAGGSVSREYAKIAQQAGAFSIDKSSAFRMEADVPLVVPEINGHLLKELPPRNLVATPNCSTIQMVQVLHALRSLAPLKRVVCCTYQAVSGAGQAGVKELEGQVRAMFNFKEAPEADVFGQRIAFNVLPAIPGRAPFDDDGVAEEERKMMNESKRILEDADLKIGVTCVRVPVFNGHSEAVHVEFGDTVHPDAVRECLTAAPNIMVIDDPKKSVFPTVQDAIGQDKTLVGRIRRDPAFDNGIAMWIVSDNLRTGAALNAVRIAERWAEEQSS